MAPPSDLAGLVRPEWPPLRHVRRGWEHLDESERAEVAQRVEAVLAAHQWGPHSRDALLHLFTFLAQAETIAIEIPLRFLPHAPAQVRPLLRRQLVDEVFHSTLFARLAHELAAPASQPPAPLPSAERLLERIRQEPDLAVTATLLNLVAEGWIETLFKHALRWRIAPAVFKAVLADEARHVDEASAYTKGMDLAQAQQAVRAFEQGMMEVGGEPSVALAILDLAGEAGQRLLSEELYETHRRNLAEAGLQPSAEWTAMVEAGRSALLAASPADRARRVVDTHWRRLARRVWTTPRDPTMQGDFDVAVGHVPRKALTPVLIAALGRAWAKHPELNRMVARDGVWELPYANVGVRVLLDDDELATVVIPQADRRSVRDIRRMLADGIQQLRRQRDLAKERPPPPLPDPEVAALMPALPHMFAVAISNAGKWGVVSGAGSFSGPVSPSTDITIGLRRRLPRWRGVAYLPAWHVNVAAIQDHRVFDGRASATTVTAIQEQLSPAGVKAILAAKDTLPSPEDLPDLPEMERAGAAAATPAFALVGALGLPKYTPLVIGGLGLGALAGVGGYLLYQNLHGAAAAGAAIAKPPTPPSPPPKPEAPLDAPDLPAKKAAAPAKRAHKPAAKKAPRRKP
ncbi:MAG: 2-oxo acid dehydrogenase subunit E2 [Halobacteriales archaeon]|nr:2-oxo acid dehydrogenase subunit E2 [Halobacteriales archaeon]